MTIDQKFDSLKPGLTIELSKIGLTRVFAERSGKGDVIRIVRETRDANSPDSLKIEVVKTIKA